MAEKNTKSWKDVIRNKSILEQTSQEYLELSVQERRLRWLEYVQRMSDDRIDKQVLHEHQKTAEDEVATHQLATYGQQGH